jgi:hypothetical protein
MAARLNCLSRRDNRAASVLRLCTLTIAYLTTLSCSRRAANADGAIAPASPAQAFPTSLAMGGAKSVTRFFVTSRGLGRGGDLGGLAPMSIVRRSPRLRGRATPGVLTSARPPRTMLPLSMHAIRIVELQRRFTCGELARGNSVAEAKKLRPGDAARLRIGAEVHDSAK